MTKYISLIAIATIIFAAIPSTVANADDQSSGCGLGWAVTKKMSLVASTTRNTTHAILPPTFGMTSGTSGCAHHSLVKKGEEAAVLFASSNYEPLRIEMAEGRGEYLQAFARTMGCNDASVDAFGTATQKNYKAIFDGAKNSIDIFLNVKQQIRKNPALAANCHLV